MSLRNLQRRMAKLERAGKPRPSPVIILYGSFEAFVQISYADIRAGKLAQDDMLAILEALGRWEADGTWEVANAAR